ncbi:MAG: nucleotidyltransferase family protein, partial [Blautia sp.]|nr:nucleotidyltransferase family protein [Blautia sp.]
AETPSISDMMAVADILTREPDEFRAKLKELQKSGVSFPGARAEAVLSYLKTAGAFAERETDPSRLLSDIGGLLSSPNNILGIEYCKALIRLHSSIQPVPIRRKGGGYFSPASREDDPQQDSSSPASREDDPQQDSPSPSLLSAFAIRDEIRRVSSSTCTGGNMEGLRRFLLRCMPEEAALLLFRLVQENSFLFEDSLDLLLGYRLLQETLESLRSYADISEPVARRILHFRNQYSGFLSFTDLLKTRDVAQTRISRCLCRLVLELPDTCVSPTYARVLGFRKESASLLSAIKEGSRLPLVTKASEVSRVLDAAGTAQYAKGVWASDVYQLLLSRKSRKPFLQEHQKKVVLL